MTYTTPPSSVTPDAAAEMIRVLLRANIAPCLWGSPGIGKSEIVAQVAAAEGYELLDLRLSQLDPVDLRGLPRITPEGRSAWAVPTCWPVDPAARVLVFLDEANRAPNMMQNAALQLVRDRRIGEYQLPPLCRVAAACNPVDVGAGRLSAAFANRFAHIYVDADVDAWSRWALNAGIHPIAIAFIRYRPELLNQFDPRANAYPTPRTWAQVSDVTQTQPPASIELALIAGLVGHPAAVEYLAFCDLYRHLPTSPDAILLDPTGAPVPTDPASLYALSSALAHRADPDNLGRVITYLDRLPQEFSVFAVQSAIRRDPLNSATPEFTRWAIAHADLV